MKRSTIVPPERRPRPTALRPAPAPESAAAAEPSGIPIVYIAGPYRAEHTYRVVENINEARRYAALVWSIGGAALCPHSNTALFDGVTRDADFLAGDLEMMRRCDAVFLMPRWRDSVGATLEAKEAKRVGLVVIDDEVELRRWIAARLRGAS